MRVIGDMIAVMQAFADGKRIECRTSGTNNGYTEVTWPQWDWLHSDYRVMNEPKYVPYKTYQEMIEDYCKRFDIEYAKNKVMPQIWLKAKNTDYIIQLTSFTGGEEAYKLLNSYYNTYTYLDGSAVDMEVS